MVGVDLWNYNTFFVNIIIAAFVLSSLLFTFVSQRYYKKKLVDRIMSEIGEGVKVMY